MILKKDKDVSGFFEITDNSPMGKIIGYRDGKDWQDSSEGKNNSKSLLENFEVSVFNEDSKKYSGISKKEFNHWIEILRHLDELSEKEKLNI